MKKILAMLLAICLCFGLCACTVDLDDDADEKKPQATNESQTGNNDADLPTDGTTDAEEDETTQPENKPAVNEITFTELVVVDNASCKITITGIEPDNLWGYTLKAEFENKTEENVLVFSVEDAFINGLQNDPFFATEVAGGKKSKEHISFYDFDAEEHGVGYPTDIEINFRVYDSEDWLADDIADETVHIYPYGEENATVFVREPQASDLVLIDNEYATVIVTGYEVDELWGYTAKLFLVNKTNTTLMFSADDASINGYMCDPLFSDMLAGGKCCFSGISWSDSTLEESEITEVEEIEFVLSISDWEDWLADDLVNEKVTLNP